MGILDKIFGTYSDRELKKIKNTVDKVMSLEKEYRGLSDKELQNKTAEFKARLTKETLDDILPEAFATVRETAFRVLGMLPYEVQVYGAVILHQGRIAEMKTGEGKTLVATMPAYLNALNEDGVFIVTVNEYLAKRDSEQMGKIYNFLGLSVGVIENYMKANQRKDNYSRDVIYTTNNELGFDYLKDNMVMNINNKSQRSFNYAIIDEVDSILIDEARTPLIISGAGDDVSEGYKFADKLVRKLKGVVDNEDSSKSKIMEMIDKGEDEAGVNLENFDYVVNEKRKSATLTDRGMTKVERYYNVKNLGDIENLEINHYISRSLKAHSVFKKDIDYVIEDGEIMIIDEHTGRLMKGRRYNEGIHQAIETKEGVKIQSESKTLATISFQNLFKKFKKLGGMTGTAMTEKDEFVFTYGLDCVGIPTNKPLIRDDKIDRVYMTKSAKLKGILETVNNCVESGQPILIGTASVEASEELSALFKNQKIKHKVLNAKQHEQEAKIIAQAGEFGSVTIATNMAGRGTDIILGGNVDFKVKEELKRLDYTNELIEESNTHSSTDELAILAIREKYKELYEEISLKTQPWAEKVRSVGGLYILGSERHNSRRIDNQLRGRAGRQGDPGTSEFLISMEDDLMRLFGGNKVLSILGEDIAASDEPMNFKILANQVEGAQRRIEGFHFTARKQVMEYDNIMNIQRDIVYQQRDEFLKNDDIFEDIISLIHSYIEDNVMRNIIKDNKVSLVDQENIKIDFEDISALKSIPNYTEDELMDIKPENIINNMKLEVSQAIEFFEQANRGLTTEHLKSILISLIDRYWQEHLIIMGELEEGIGLRAYGQKNPLEEYTSEGFNLFEEMLSGVRKEIFNAFMKNHELISQEEII